jgi:hypothetical protein
MMSSKLTFVFLLWRREGTTPEQFADYYERNHLPFLSTLVPPPPIHERSYPLDSNAITPANRPREGIFSFDSVMIDAMRHEKTFISTNIVRIQANRVSLCSLRYGRIVMNSSQFK